MDLYDLSFNALICNVQKDCTVFFCPKNCKFIKTMAEDLNVNIESEELPYDLDAVCLGKVYSSSFVKRMPTVYVQGPGYYCDITVTFVREDLLQIMIIKTEEHPDIPTVEEDYDLYKLYYEYVGGITDFKARMNFEYDFLNGVDGIQSADRDTVFRKNISEKIIKKLFG